MKKAINYQGLGEKNTFGFYCLITHYNYKKSTIQKISKQVFDSLAENGFSIEG